MSVSISDPTAHVLARIRLPALLLSCLVVSSASAQAADPMAASRHATAFELALTYVEGREGPALDEHSPEYQLFAELLDTLVMVHPELQYVTSIRAGEGERFRHLRGRRWFSTRAGLDLIDSVSHEVASWATGCGATLLIAPLSPGERSTSFDLTVPACTHPVAGQLRALGFTGAGIATVALRDTVRRRVSGEVELWLDASGSPFRDMQDVLRKVRAVLGNTLTSGILDVIEMSPGAVYFRVPTVTLDSTSRWKYPETPLIVTYLQGWGDCSVGCIQKHTWTFRVSYAPPAPGESRYRFSFGPPEEAGAPIR